MLRIVPVALLVLGAVAFADDVADREKLMGEWKGQDAGDVTWILKDNGETLQITRMQNNQKVSDFECNTVGRECRVKDSGKDVKVSMWFNGPKLIVLETRGSEVVRRLLQAVQSDKLDIEVDSIVPDRKPEVLHLTRQTQTAAQR